MLRLFCQKNILSLKILGSLYIFHPITGGVGLLLYLVSVLRAKAPVSFSGSLRMTAISEVEGKDRYVSHNDSNLWRHKKQRAYSSTCLLHSKMLPRWEKIDEILRERKRSQRSFFFFLSNHVWIDALKVAFFQQRK